MRIVILGAGPAGLYLAYLIKRRQPDADVCVLEQNAADATFGFGVVFSDRALDFLHDARRQQADRDLVVADGWRYFIHGWTQVVAEVFDIAMPPDTVEELAVLAERVR